MLERRLRAERTEWANVATMARLERDQARTELQNAKRELNLARAENRKLKAVLASAADLMTSKQWASSSLGPVTNGCVGRLRAAIDACRSQAPGRDVPLAEIYGLETQNPEN